jgi:RNA polymerase sigma-70 factor (ECF subfamily)
VLATLEVAYAGAHADAALAGDEAEFGLEVLRLSAALAEMLPWEAEVLAFAALVRLAEARRGARVGADGAMIPLSAQDPRLWDEAMMAEGEALLGRAARLAGRGPYQLLAAIHAAHAGRRWTGETPWSAIVGLYDALAAYRPGPVTAVNRAAALAEAQGPAAGLAALEAAAGERSLEGWLPYQAARAAMLAGLGRCGEAAAAYQAALSLSPGAAERLWLQARRDSL